MKSNLYPLVLYSEPELLDLLMSDDYFKIVFGMLESKKLNDSIKI